MKFVLSFLTTSLLCVVASSDSVSLCTNSEKVYFSCATKASGKLLSVCGSKDLSSSDAYLQYRFGSPEKIELQFPSDHAGSIQSFRFYHYVRPQVTRIGLTFKIEKYSYTVFYHYEGDMQPVQTLSGVSVYQMETNKESEISCKAEVKNAFIDLEEVVPCDPENALSNCSE